MQRNIQQTVEKTKPVFSKKYGALGTVIFLGKDKMLAKSQIGINVSRKQEDGSYKNTTLYIWPNEVADLKLLLDDAYRCTKEGFNTESDLL